MASNIEVTLCITFSFTPPVLCLQRINILNSYNHETNNYCRNAFVVTLNAKAQDPVPNRKCQLECILCRRVKKHHPIAYSLGTQYMVILY